MNNLNESIINIRVELQRSNINKSGKNKFQGFTYFELGDFLPRLNELMSVEKVNDIITIQDNVMTLTLVKGDEREQYSIPFHVYDTPLNKQGGKSMQDIQYLGALNTYYKRYLYLNAFGITDGEVIDGLDNTPKQEKPVRGQNKYVPEQLERQEPARRVTVDTNNHQADSVLDDMNTPESNYVDPKPFRVCPECGEQVPEKIGKTGNPYYRCFDCGVFVD